MSKGFSTVTFFVSILLLAGCGSAVQSEYERGVKALHEGDDDLAISCLNKVLDRQPNNAEALNWRGVARQGKYDEEAAIADFTEAIRIDPKPGFHVNRAVSYVRRERWDLALADLNRAIEMQPDAAQAYYRRGLLDGHGRTCDEAMADLRTAIRLKPDWKQPREALVNLQEIIKLRQDLMR